MKLISQQDIEREKRRLRRTRSIGIGVCVGLCLLCACVWLSSGTKKYVVNGLSMTPTLCTGDTLQYSKFHTPAYGDIIVFDSAYGLLVKRVIGLPGDVISVKDDGSVTRNGIEIEEVYAEKDALGNSGMPEVEVKEDALFVLGDNRGASMDSRDPRIGQVCVTDVYGTVIGSQRALDAN